MEYHVIHLEEKTANNHRIHQFDNTELLNSITNVEWNILDYKQRKKQCKHCSMQKTKQTCKNCNYSLPYAVHLKIMEKRKKELWAEYNHRHKGEIRWDGTIL